MGRKEILHNMMHHMRRIEGARSEVGSNLNLNNSSSLKRDKQGFYSVYPQNSGRPVSTAFTNVPPWFAIYVEEITLVIIGGLVILLQIEVKNIYIENTWLECII
jgi:hypothetical protein